jgi:hypothetical protein
MLFDEISFGLAIDPPLLKMRKDSYLGLRLDAR